MISSVDFAVLAPVPEEHLLSGLEVVLREGFVAYGSRKWELFEEVDRLRGGEPVPVLIYPSDEDHAVKMSYLSKWSGMYVGHVRSQGGTHPAGMKYRPESVEQYPNDLSGYWAVFWHVAQLQRLDEANHKAISSLQSYRAGKYWKAGSPPRGPEIIARPGWM